MLGAEVFVPVSYVIVHGRMLMHDGQAGDGSAMVYLLPDDGLGVLQSAVAIPRGEVNVSNSVVM